MSKLQQMLCLKGCKKFDPANETIKEKVKKYGSTTVPLTYVNINRAFR